MCLTHDRSSVLFNTVLRPNNPIQTGMNCNPSKPTAHRFAGRLVSSCALAVALLTPLAVGVSTASAADAAATGVIRGRVLNVENGKYLPRARVTVEGTNIETFTNDYGEYELRDVPAGQVVVKADFAGQNSAKSAVSVSAGQIANQNLRFNQKKGASEDGAIMLDEFVVASERYKNAQEIAINVERNSTNIKNVVSTDQFGDIPNANVGELVKFMPGVLVSYGGTAGANQGYSDSDASGVSVRGFGPEDTAILVDGMPMSSSIPGSLTRQVGLDMLSINNASRVELIKVPTADMPSNSIGGQVNLITKSAFEFAKPSVSGRVFFNINTLHLSPGKSVGPNNKKTYKAQPGLEFSAIYPISPKFGFTVTGFSSREFGQTYRLQPIYTSTGTNKNAAGETVSMSNPYLGRIQVTDNPKLVDRRSGNVKLDWKPTPTQRLSANFQYSTYDEEEAQRRVDIRTASPSDWGPTFTTMTVVNNSAANNMTVTTRDRTGDTRQLQLHYDLQLGGWTVTAAGSRAISRGDYVDRANGHFSEVSMQLQPGIVSFIGSNEGVPEGIVFRTRANQPVDATQLSNWRVDGTTAKSGEASNKDTESVYRVDLRRELDFIPWLGSNTMSIQTGVRRDEEKRQKWGVGSGYREVLRSGATFSPADVLDDTYLGQTPGFGLAPQQWASSYKLYELDQKNDIFVAPTDGADAVGNWDSYVNQQKSMTEKVDAAYIMVDGSFLKNRLKLNLGARQERKKREGYGPYTDSKWNYIKNPNGTLYIDANNPTGVRIDQSNSPVFAQNAAGDALRQTLKSKGIAIPDHVYGPVASSLESRMLNLIPNRYVNQSITGDPSYSANIAYDLTKKIVIKLAWSRTFGLPNLEDGTQGLLSGNNQFSINENVPVPSDGTKGTISIANPGLKPSTSNNWDLEISYYTDNGGKFSLSGYTKTVTNQVITYSAYSGTPLFNEIVGILGLTPEDYDNWRVSTSTNSDTEQTTKGLEFQAQQDFGFLGSWGKHFQGFATFTYKVLADPPTIAPVILSTPSGGTFSFTPGLKTISLTSNRSATAGLQYSDRRFSVQLRGTFRNRNEVSHTTLTDGNVIRVFEPSEIRVDINTSYRFSERYSAFIGVRDAFNASRKRETKDDFGLIPAWSFLTDRKDFGTVITVGVNGQF